MGTSFSSSSIQCDLIIPVRTLNLVARNLSDEGEQEIIIGKNHVLFKFSDTLIYSRIIIEPYPDYERVIPEQNSRELVIDRETVIASVKRVSLFSNPISYQVKLNLNENKLNIFAQDIDFGGEAHETIACEYQSPELDIAYNANYLLDILRHIDGEKLRVKLKSSDGPGWVYPYEQKEHEQLIMLIMPVRLSG